MLRRPASASLVWDLPTRLGHWLLVLLVTGSLVTGQLAGSWIEWHGYSGLGIIWLLSFRLAWGVLGSTYARFQQFFPSPARLRLFFRGQWYGLGHSPLAALSVLALLAVLLVQAGAGLFSADDTGFAGPLRAFVSAAWAERLSGWHRLSANAVYGVIALHVAAIAWYRYRGKSLTAAMIDGYAREGDGESACGGGVSVFLLACALASMLTYAASGLWIVPEPVVATPAW